MPGKNRLSNRFVVLKRGAVERRGMRNALSVSRLYTARAHAALERHPVLARLVAPDCTGAEYARAVRSLATVYAGIDRLLLAAEPYRPAAVGPFRPRAPSLVAECAAMGSRVDPRKTAPLPELAGVGAYLGARYVVDGAQLGHRQIAASLARSPVATVLDRPQSFWRTAFVYPDEWRKTREVMADLTDRREIAAAAVSARALFQYFHRHLERIMVETTQ